MSRFLRASDRRARSPLGRTVTAALLMAAVAACAGDGGGNGTAAPAPAVTATTAPPGTLETPSPTAGASVAPEDDAQVVAVTVTGGQVTGAQPRTEVQLGTRLRLTITSDAVDQVHVHGYDVVQPVPAGQAVNVEFVADRPGVFEVELHDAGTVLTRLQVQ